MTTLYGIWYADYSNSSVDERVFTSREDAIAVCRATGGSLQEFELDAPLRDEETVKRGIRPGEMVFHVAMYIDGGGAQAWEQESSVEPDSHLSVQTTGKRISGETWATDEKHAIKIINDRRVQWIAAGSHRNPTHEKGNPYWHEALMHPFAEEPTSQPTVIRIMFQ